jgi:hypothetical protein
VPNLGSQTSGATTCDPPRLRGIASSGPEAWSDGVGKRINTATRIIGKDSGSARLTDLYSGIRRRSEFCSTPIPAAQGDSSWSKRGMCRLWLKGPLNVGPMPVKEIRSHAEAGFASTVL